MTPQGQVLFDQGKLIRARAEPFLLMVTGVKSFVISNDREKSDFVCLNEKDRSLPLVEMTGQLIIFVGPKT